MRNLVLDLPIGAVHLWAVYLIAVVFFVIVAVALLFHWSYYGVQDNPRVYVRGLFFTIGIGILSAALLFLSFYSAT